MDTPPAAAAIPILVVDMVPRPFWRSSLATRLPRAEWERCRAWALAAAGDRCVVCRRAADDGVRLERDEVWEYEVRRQEHVRYLAGLRAVCSDCHSVKHFGRTVRRGRSAATTAVSHLMRQNGWSSRQAKEHVDQAFALWAKRNSIAWARTDLTWLTDTLGIDAAL
jgi:hypothetical protein